MVQNLKHIEYYEETKYVALIKIKKEKQKKVTGTKFFLLGKRRNIRN